MRKVPRIGILCVISLLCLFVALSGATVALTAFQDDDSGQATIRTADNSTNYLSPSTETTNQYQEVSIDVGSAVDTSAQELQAEYEIRSFNRQLQFIEDTETRNSIGQAKLETIERRYLSFDKRQQALFEQYSAGEISRNRFASELVRLETAIEMQQTFREQVFVQVYERTRSSPSEDFLRRFNSLELSLTPDQPVTDRIRAAMTGEQDPVLVYSQSAEDALVLATIDDDTYVRQATIRSERNLGGEDQFTDLWRDATNRAGTLYPWTFRAENLRDVDPFNLEVYSQVYAVQAQHTQGELSVYMDGATGNVFHENQLKMIRTQPITRTVQNETESYIGAVSVTNEAGPMRVSVTNNAGAPVEDAAVTVDGTPVGVTDNTGALWVVQPAGEFDVGVTTPDDETLTIQIEESSGL